MRSSLLRVGVLPMRGTEDADDAGQRSFDSESYVERLYRQPDGVHADHLCSSHTKPARSLNGFSGHVMPHRHGTASNVSRQTSVFISVQPEGGGLSRESLNWWRVLSR